MQKRFDELSVFFPAYNEEENIASTVQKAAIVCEKLANKYEIIVVNDGSEDATQQVVEDLIKENSNIRLISHSPNRGYGAALKTGMYAVRYNWIVFNDGDGQFDFSQIDRFLPYISEYKVIVGYRARRAEGLKRLINAKAWGTLVKLLFGMHIRDIDCAFKLFHKEVLNKIPKLEAEGALISTEFLVKVKKAGFKIKEVPVDHYKRQAGNPTGAKLSVIIKAFVELFKLKNKLQ